MDKETLSNYGWIVICVLVLAVMIALATPFGDFIANGVKSTTQGLFDASYNALEAANVPGLTIDDQNFDTQNKAKELIPGAVFTFYVEENYIDGDLYPTDIVGDTFITWEDLKLDKNGHYYGYAEDFIIDTAIIESAFSFCDCIKNIVFPNGMKFIGNSAFAGCTSLESVTIPKEMETFDTAAFMDCSSLSHIEFTGTKAQWNAISFGEYWNSGCNEITVTCTDGKITIPAKITN